MGSYLYFSNLTDEQECDLLGLDHDVICRYETLTKSEAYIDAFELDFEEANAEKISASFQQLDQIIEADKELATYYQYQLSGLGKVYWKKDNNGCSRDRFDIESLLEQVNRLDLLEQIQEVWWG